MLKVQKRFSWGLFGGLAESNKAAAASSRKDKAVRAHKVLRKTLLRSVCCCMTP